MQKKSPKPLFHKLFYRYSAIIICIVLALVIYFISAIRSNILTTNLNYMDMMTENAVSYIEESAQTVDYIHANLYQSSSIMEDMLQYFRLGDEEYQKYRLNSYIATPSGSYKSSDDFIEDMMQAYSDIESIELISYSKALVTLCYPDGKTYLRQNAEERMQDVESGDLASDGILSFVKEIRDQNTMTGVGCMIINFHADELKQIQQYHAMAELMVYNQANTVIYCSDKGLVQQEFFQAEEAGTIEGVWNAYIEKSDVKEYVVVSLLNKQKAAYMPWSLFLTITGLGCFVIVLGMLAIRYYLERLTTRLNGIIEGMHKITTGDLSVRLESDQNGDELDVIASHFNEMCRELERYIQKSYLAEIEQKNAELETLQNQINPHFLYNTLEAIRMKAICNGDREVGKMLYSMAVIFRSQLKEDDKITVVQELHYCKKYLELFEFRYQGKFSSSTECPESLMNYTIMKFTMQPIIENYFVHGIRGEQDGNEIHIWVEKQKDALLIHVEDNGKGMNPADIEAKNRELREDKHVDKKSVGIMNVNRRVKAVYGDEYGVILKESETGGMHVIVKVKADEMQHTDLFA